MDAGDMYDQIEYYYDDILEDYLFPKNAKDNPEIEDTDYMTDYMEDPEFQKYAEEWVSNHSADLGDIAYDAWKEDGDGK